MKQDLLMGNVPGKPSVFVSESKLEDSIEELGSFMVSDDFCRRLSGFCVAS